MTKSLVLGVGVNNKSRKAGCGGSGNMTREYKLWKGILQRCYDQKSLDRYPTYLGCYVSENFKFYSFFYDWCQEQKGFDYETSHLDKDLLSYGNKEYGERFCVFVPREVNMSLTLSNAARGEFPLGVNKTQDGKFIARCWKGEQGHVYLGRFAGPVDAHIAYCSHKNAYVQSLAAKYKGVLDERVFDALRTFSIEKFTYSKRGVLASTGECEACQ